MPAPGIQIKGLREMTAALKDVDKTLGREMGKASKAAGEVIVPAARSRVSGLSPMQAKVAPSIKAAATQKGVTIRAGGKNFPELLAMGALLGAKRYRQFPAWVGNDWTVGGPGGPYGLNAAIRDKTPQVIDVYARIIGGLLARTVFPD